MFAIVPRLVLCCPVNALCCPVNTHTHARTHARTHVHIYTHTHTHTKQTKKHKATNKTTHNKQSTTTKGKKEDESVVFNMVCSDLLSSGCSSRDAKDGSRTLHSI